MNAWRKEGFYIRMLIENGWNGELESPFYNHHNKDCFGQELLVDAKYKGEVLTRNRMFT